MTESLMLWFIRRALHIYRLNLRYNFLIRRRLRPNKGNTITLRVRPRVLSRRLCQRANTTRAGNRFCPTGVILLVVPGTTTYTIRLKGRARPLVMTRNILKGIMLFTSFFGNRELASFRK